MKIDNRKDILLLLLYSPGRSGYVNEPVIGRTRLLKMLFIFKQEALIHFRKGTEISDATFYQYFPWNFGPFSTEVYDDLAFFQLRGFITVTPSKEERITESVEEWLAWKDRTGLDDDDDLAEEYFDYQEDEFSLTEKGVQWVATNLFPLISTSQKRLLQEFKSRLNSMPLRSILRYVYTEYPDMTERSQIVNKVLD